MAEQIENLARFVAETRWEHVPEAVRDQAKLVLLDTVGVILAGAEQPEVRALQQRLQKTAGTGATVFTRGWPSTDPGRAALLNGIAGRSIELCEGHADVSCQAAVQVVPGVLSIAEAAGIGGRDVLAALVLGYEAAVRIAAATTRRPLAHPNGQVAMLGAITAGARLRGFDAQATSCALRAGVVLLLTVSYTHAPAGATALNVAGGMSGFAAALVPDLVLSGFTAQPDAVEQALSALVAEGFEPSRLDEDLGTTWAISGTRFRLRACCHPIYPALDALEDALAELEPRAEDIERIDVATYRFASVMRAAHPQGSFGAHYSLPHAAAALIVKGDLGLASFTEDTLRNPTLAALRDRVHVAEDPAMSAALPARKPARVRLVLKDGREVTCTRDRPRRDSERPYTEAELRGKFRELAGLVLTDAGVTAVERAIGGVDTWAEMSALTALLRRHERAPAG